MYLYFMQLTLMVEPVLNISCRFVKISCKDTAKVSSLSLLETTTKPTYFLPAKNKIPILWIQLQTNKNTKNLKTLHLNKKR